MPNSMEAAVAGSLPAVWENCSRTAALQVGDGFRLTPTLDRRSPNEREGLRSGTLPLGPAGARPASRRRRSIDVLPNQCGDLCRMAARKKVIPAFNRDKLRPRN